MKNIFKNGDKWSILCVALSVLLAAQICVAGFVRPGWFVKDRGGAEQDEAVTSGEFEITPETSPGNPAFIDVTYTADEIAAAPAAETAVSPAAPTATAGAVTVSFPTWDLSEADTLSVRTLPEKTDPATGEKLIAYDLSLLSGQHQFATNMTVRIPRTAGDHAGRVMWLNPGTDTWEPLIFKVSEDGLYYDVYLDHFSIIAEGVKEFVERSDGCMFRIEKLDKSGEPYPKLQEPVAFNEEEAIRLLMCDLSGIDEITLSDGIPPDTAVTSALAMLNTGLGYADAANTFAKLDSALSDVAKQRLSGTVAGIGAALTIARVCYQLKNSPDYAAVIQENRMDIIGSSIGVGGAVAGAAGLTATSAALGYVGAGLVAYTAAEAAVDSLPGPPAEVAYWCFMEHKVITVDGKNITLGMQDARWAETLRAVFEKHKDDPKAINAAVEKLYDDYVNEFWTTLDAEGRRQYHDILAEEFREKCKEDPELEKWNLINYTSPYVEPGEEEKQALIKRAKSKVMSASKSELAAISETYLVDSMKEVVKKVYGEYLPYLNQYVTINVRDKGLEKGQKFSDSPYASWKDAETMFTKAAPFSMLPEYAEMWTPDAMNIAFADPKPITFWPSNTTVDDYNPTQVVPHSIKGSDTIFACRMYNYIQLGSPTKLIFKGDGTEQHKEYPAEFKLPKNRGNYIDVYVDIDRTPDPTTTPAPKKVLSYRLLEDSWSMQTHENPEAELFGDYRAALRLLLHNALKDAVITPDASGTCTVAPALPTLSSKGDFAELTGADDLEDDVTVNYEYAYAPENIFLLLELPPEKPDEYGMAAGGTLRFQIIVEGHDSEDSGKMDSRGSVEIDGDSGSAVYTATQEIDGKTYQTITFNLALDLTVDMNGTATGDWSESFAAKEADGEHVSTKYTITIISTEPIE